MEKKYQIFISSTYTDLIEVRREIAKAVLRQTEIPAAMEDFGSVDQSALEYIKAVIDQCDYYILIIAGRYGTVDESGLSYTEQEYDYALKKSKTILVFIKKDIASIPSKDVDTDKQLRKKLEKFRAKVSKGRLVTFWDDPKVLITDVMIALSNAFRTHPGQGWIRAQQFAEMESVEIKRLEYENHVLKMELNELRSSVQSHEIDYEDLFTIYKIEIDYYVNLRSWTMFVELSWIEIFMVIGPIVKVHSGIKTIQDRFSSIITTAVRSNKSAIENAEVSDNSFGVITSYFTGCGFIEIRNESTLFVTTKGRKIMNDYKNIINK